MSEAKGRNAAPRLTRVEIEGGVARLTLDRPEARNALSRELLRSMTESIQEIGSRCAIAPGVGESDAQVRGVDRADSVRVVILAGEGKSFCAGMDLRAVADDPVAMGDALRDLSRVNRLIRRLPVPVIAQVQGAAIGGGCGLMVVSDFAFTHAEAKLGYPEVELGICPAVVAPWLVQRIGAGRARAMLLAGGTMSGAEGFAAGLASHLVPIEQLASATAEFASRLARGGPAAIAATKRWLNELDGSMDDAVADRAAEISAQIIAGPEAQARLRRP